MSLLLRLMIVLLLVVALVVPVVKAGEEVEICRCISPQCIQLGDVFQECLCLTDNLNSCNSFSLCCGGGGGNRRRLGDDASVVDDNDNPAQYRNYVDQCGDNEYDAAIHVDHGHLYAVATPKDAAVTAGCPLMAAHAVFRHETTTAKQLLIWDSDNNDTKEEKESVLRNGSSLSVGSFKLSELLSAYEKADPTTTTGGYDVLTNNCGNFVVDLASHLGIEIDGRVKAFVARRLLLESGSQLVAKIRNHWDYVSLFKGSSDGDNRNLRSVSDEVLVELLVEKTASGHQQG